MKRCGVMEGGSYKAPPRTQDALSTLLKSLGFTTMAEEVLTEGDPAQLRRYARVIAKNLPNNENRQKVLTNLRLLKLI
jgi:hypothetical protein